VKVLHLINTLSAGGAEMHLLTLCRHLKRQNVEIVVACLREHVKDSRSLRLDFEEENIRILNLQADSRYDTFFLGRIARVVREERPDILHTHLPRADFAGAFVRFFHPGLVWVCSVHAIYSNDWSGRWSLPLFNLLWRRSDVMLCISHAVRDWLVSRGVPPGKARVIHYGIEPEKFSKSAVNRRDQWGLNDNVVIGSIGRLEPGKGHDLLIQAMPELCKPVPSARLLIAGHDPWGYGASLSRLIDRLGLEEKVRLLGFQADVVSFLNTLDIFAFASSSEGFGQVLVEAMAAGKPVVASKISPLTEIVVDEKTGLLVEEGNVIAFANSLFRLLSHPEERESMGRLGQQRVKKEFTAQKMSQETLSLYEEVLRRTSVVRSPTETVDIRKVI
jgi:glycosyltransferase involved in cell wall biosynthesis